MKGLSMDTIEAWHGTVSGYSNHKCRCEDCKSASTAYQAAYHVANSDKKKALASAWRGANPERVKAVKAAWRTANPEKVKAYTAAYAASHRNKVRDQRYGLTPGRFETMLANQANQCAICRVDFGDQTPHVDHDHACCPGGKSCGECVRGLLCNLCNQGLGRFKDDPARLVAALDYLNR